MQYVLAGRTRDYTATDCSPTTSSTVTERGPLPPSSAEHTADDWLAFRAPTRLTPSTTFYELVLYTWCMVGLL